MENITISHGYETVKKLYDEEFNRDKRLVKTSNDEPTPIDLSLIHI